jgi:transcriptional regulator with XRE-family HTH domain
MNNNMRSPDSVGSTIRALREKREITQHELARLACLERAQLSRIESGKCTPRLETLDRIAKALNTDSSRLLAA